MKYIMTFLLMAALATPSFAQEPDASAQAATPASKGHFDCDKMQQQMQDSCSKNAGSPNCDKDKMEKIHQKCTAYMHAVDNCKPQMEAARQACGKEKTDNPSAGCVSARDAYTNCVKSGISQ